MRLICVVSCEDIRNRMVATLAPIRNLAQIRYAVTDPANPSGCLSRAEWQTTALCGVILVIEPGALKNQAFQSVAETCLEILRQRDDFRIFLYYQGMTKEDINNVGKQDTLLQELLRVHAKTNSDYCVGREYIANLEAWRVCEGSSGPSLCL